jgi:hypothetical protein
MSGYGHDEAMRDVWLKEPHEFVSEVILAKRERLAAYIEHLEAERAKHAALVEAAKAVDDYVSGHFSRDKVQYIDCPPCREKLLALRAVLADLEASDD